MPPHIAIVGGGFGGLHAARALAGQAVRVTLVDRHNYHLFQPLLYQVATAGLSPGDIASPIRWILRRQRNLQVLLASVEGLDPDRRTLRLDRGEDLSYDFLILAAGSTHSYFGHDEWEKAAPGLKTLDDALHVRRRMLLAFERAERTSDPDERRRLLTFAVVGGGPTGVELAGAVAEIARHTLSQEFRSIEPGASRVILIEAGPRILPAFPESLQQASERSLARLGVEVWKSKPVTRISDCLVELGDERLAAGTVLWAAGVAASPLGRSLGAPLDRAGRVLVNEDLSVPRHPEVFVVGDLARYEQGGTMLPGVAQVAMQQGRHAARNILRTLKGAPRTAFRYRDYGNMATIGRAAAVADFGWLRLSGWLAWMAWLLVHIMKLVGFRNRVGVLIQWAWAYFTYQRSVRLITGKGGEPSAEPAGDEPRRARPPDAGARQPTLDPRT